MIGAASLMPCRRDFIYRVCAEANGPHGVLHAESADGCAQYRAQLLLATRKIMMRYSIAVAAAVSALALSACDRPTVVAPAAPPTVVAVPVPGPAGPQGATGAPAEKGETGATGATGSVGMTGSAGSTGAEGAQGEKGKTGSNTIVVVPEPAPKR
jgi:hypothetical protein